MVLKLNTNLFVCSSSAGVPLGAYSLPSTSVEDLTDAPAWGDRQPAMSGFPRVEQTVSANRAYSAPPTCRDTLVPALARGSKPYAVGAVPSSYSPIRETLAIEPFQGAPCSDIESGSPFPGLYYKESSGPVELSLPPSARSEVGRLLETAAAKEELLPTDLPDDLVSEPGLEIDPEVNPL